MIKTSTKEYRVEIDSTNPHYYLPANIGLAKGDLIVFKGESDPGRFSAGAVADKVMVTDPTSDTGWVLKAYGGGGGGGSDTQTITLVNNTGSTISAGTIVTLDEDGGEREIRKATNADTVLFITSDDSATGEDVECYAFPNTICNVLCADETIDVGDNIGVSSTSGIGTAAGNALVGIALTGKTAGAGITAIKVLIRCFTATYNYTISTTDLIDGVSALAKDHFYFYYEA